MLLLTCDFLGSQEVLLDRVQIVSAELYSSIPYAHALIIGSDKGFVADENGVILIDNQMRRSSDTLLLQAIGYKSRKVPIADIQSIVSMSEIGYALNEVVINGSKTKIQVGGTKPRRHEINWTGLEMLGTEIGTYINNAPFGKWISGVQFYIRRNRCDSILFRLRLYEASAHSDAVRLLHQEDITFQIGQEKGWIKVPIEEYGLKTPKSPILVTVEALELWGDFGDKPPFSVTYDKVVEGFGTFRQYSSEKWAGNYAFKGRGLSFYLELLD